MVETRLSPEDLNYDAEGRLSLTLKSFGSKNERPFCIDWLKGDSYFRAQRYQHELIVRAVMGKKREVELVVDTTAGLGRDALILASAGVKTILLERSPIVFRLLQDAHSRASVHDELCVAAQRMSLFNLDSADWLKSEEAIDLIDQHNTTIYCDPMFPQRSKQAKAKKEMQVFQYLFSSESSDLDGSDQLSEAASVDELLRSAFECGANKVVVKRPLKAEPLVDNPSYSLKGKSVRFDIYVAYSGS